MADAKTRALAGVALFAHCGPRDLEFVASRADEVDVDGQPRRTLRPGDFFGEISMLDRGPATATVVTTTPARLMVMSHSQFRDAIKGNDDLLGSVMAAMGERLRADSLARQA